MKVKKKKKNTKKYKKKFDRTRTLLRLRDLKDFTKKSVRLREQRLKAKYRQEIESGVRESKRR